VGVFDFKSDVLKLCGTPSRGASLRDIFILNEIWAQDKYIFW
jgi:hypothetical protein